MKHVKAFDRGQSHELAFSGRREAINLTVLGILIRGPLTTVDIVERGGENPFRVAFALRRLRALGLVRPFMTEQLPGRRLWCLSGLGAEMAGELAISDSSS